MGLKYTPDPTGCRYVGHEDIKIKLNNSWIYYDGTPVYVYTNQDDDYLNLSIKSIERGSWTDWKKVSVLDAKVNQYDFPYGWFNNPETNSAAIVQRLPSRVYKQGISRGVLHCRAFYGRENELVNVGIDTLGIDAFMRAKYTTLKDAEKLLETKGYSCALSSSVALVNRNGDIMVYVDSQEVGKYHKNTGTVEVTKRGLYSIVCGYLQEVGLQ